MEIGLLVLIAFLICVVNTNLSRLKKTLQDHSAIMQDKINDLTHLAGSIESDVGLIEINVQKKIDDDEIPDYDPHDPL
jgi:hypothetical protein